MWSFEERMAYPEIGEYFEKLIIEERTENEPGFSGAIDFNFRFHREKKGEVQVVPGLKMNKKKEFSIETKSGLDFKIGDEIRFNGNPDMQFRITDIDYIIDPSDEDEYSFTNQSWKGLSEDVKIKVLTLK